MGLLEGTTPETLQQSADTYGVSRERIRQLELKGMRSLKSRLKQGMSCGTISTSVQ